MQTTILGVLTILVSLGNAAICYLKGSSPDFAGTITAVTAGIGLIKAKDAKLKY